MHGPTQGVVQEPGDGGSLIVLAHYPALGVRPNHDPEGAGRPLELAAGRKAHFDDVATAEEVIKDGQFQGAQRHRITQRRQDRGDDYGARANVLPLTERGEEVAGDAEAVKEAKQARRCFKVVLVTLASLKEDKGQPVLACNRRLPGPIAQANGHSQAKRHTLTRSLQEERLRQ